MCSYWRARFVPFFTPRGGIRASSQIRSKVYLPARTLNKRWSAALAASSRSWLRWIDDAGYRGLNAGPFALRRERDDAARSGKAVPRPGRNAKAGPVAKLQRTIAKRLEQSQTPRGH